MTSYPNILIESSNISNEENSIAHSSFINTQENGKEESEIVSTNNLLSILIVVDYSSVSSVF